MNTIRIRRPCFHCEKCGTYHIDEGESLRHGKLTPLLTERACLLSAHMPFEIAAEEIEKPDLAAAFADTPEMKSTFSNRAYVEIDGAIWIENLTKELLPYATHILDWYHVKEKLWKCAKELFGENSERCPIWVKKFSDQIWNGKIDQ
ncbi:MAG: hypothetical protein H3C35_13885, partial [Bacteroidetes bacterium]|nr:hypothetical protein [Bacteroidota bacterium]